MNFKRLRRPASKTALDQQQEVIAEPTNDQQETECETDLVSADEECDTDDSEIDHDSFDYNEMAYKENEQKLLNVTLYELEIETENYN